MGQSGAEQRGAIVIFDQRARRPAAGIGVEIIFLPRAARHRKLASNAQPSVEAELARAVFAAADLTGAESAFLFADIGQEVGAAAVMLGLDQPRLRGSGGAAVAAACLAAGVADRDFGANLGIGIGPEARIDAAEVGFAIIILVVDQRRADAQPVVVAAIAYAAAGIEHAFADAIDFIFGDDELRI